MDSELLGSLGCMEPTAVGTSLLEAKALFDVSIEGAITVIAPAAAPIFIASRLLIVPLDFSP